MRHRLRTAVWLALFGSILVIPQGSLASAQQIVLGRVSKIEPSAISLDQKAKTLRILIGPKTELWRRGIDVQKTSQFILGQDARVLYSEVASDGSLRAMLVVQFEPGDKVKMVPHQVVEYRFCCGNLVEVANGAITLRTEDSKTCTTHVDAKTDIWHGQISHDPTVLRVGDNISIENIVQYPQGNLVADKVWTETETQPTRHLVATE